MSAYIVNPKTINQILGYLSRLDKAHVLYMINRILSPIEWDLVNLAELGQAMYNMNTNAVKQRYPACDDDNLPGTLCNDGGVIPYRYKSIRCGQFQALKSIKCWLYQCSEGNVDEQALYKAFSKISNLIAMEIATSDKEYEAAQWG